MARIVRFHEFGGPEVLRVEEATIPAPAADEVQVRVKALGLNRAESMLRRDAYIETAALPASLGYEAAGIVEQVGKDVTDFAPEDAVSLIPPPTMLRWPAYAELANFPAAYLVKHPASIGWENAAALWMAYLTVYGALIDIAAIGKGDFVAISAASSSVGLAAIQVANMVGATPIAITRSSAKADALRAVGAAEVIASDEEDVVARLGSIAGPDGVRVVFDPVAGPLVEAYAQAMAPGGILFQYGALSPEPTPFPLFAALGKSLTMRGYVVHEIIRDRARLEAAKAFILGGVASGALRPVIDRSFTLDEIVEAHRYLESNAQFGKLVVTV